MKDIEIVLKNETGQLARLGEVLGAGNISLEGGGVFGNGQTSIAHFLVKDEKTAIDLLKKAGFEVKRVSEVLIVRLRQDVAGQLGLFCRKLAQANVNIVTQYSDHANQLILVVDHYDAGKRISQEWMKKWWNSEDYVI